MHLLLEQDHGGSWTREDIRTRRVRMFGDLKALRSRKVIELQRSYDLKAPRVEGSLESKGVMSQRLINAQG